MDFDFIDEQIARLKQKHNDPAYVAPNLQDDIPQDNSFTDNGNWLEAAGIGASNMLNNLVLGGSGQILGSIGDIVERFSPFSGSRANDRYRLIAAGLHPEIAQQLSPDQDSWLTALGKYALQAHNSIDDSIRDWRNNAIGDNPSYGTQVAEGVGSSLGFMGAGLAGTALSGGNVLTGAILSGLTEALSESGGTAADAYRQGLYDNGGLAAANKSFAVNALLNAGLNKYMGMFSPWMSRIRNPITRYATQTAGEVLNELVQEPSQQTIEKSAQQSLYNGGNFVTALGQNIPDWWDTAKQLAPTVAASSAITSMLKGGLDMSSAKNRQDVKDQWRNRIYDPEQTANQLKAELDARQKLQNQLARLQALTSFDGREAKINAINQSIKKADSRIATLQDRLKPGNLDYTPNTYDEFSGKVSKVTTNAGQNQYDTVFKLTEADDIITSHNDNFSVNEAFPQDRQIRQRGNEASKQEVERIATTLDPYALSDNYLAQNGAPIIGQDNTDLSGNGRVLAIRRAYKAYPERAKAYKQFIIDNAQSFGVDPEIAKNMKMPVLVRVLQGNHDLAKFATEANENTIQQLDAGEQANNDAKKILEGNLFQHLEQGKPLAQQTDFLNAFAAVLPDTDKGKLQTEHGKSGISQELVNRAQNALLSVAYGNNDIINKLTSITPNEDLSKGVSNALKALAPDFANIIAKGKSDLSIGDDIADAVKALDRFRNNKDKTTEEQIEQPNLPLDGLQLSEEAELLLRYFQHYRNNPQMILQGLANYAKFAQGQEGSNSQQGTLFGKESQLNEKKITLLELALGSNLEQAREWTRQKASQKSSSQQTQQNQQTQTQQQQQGAKLVNTRQIDSSKQETRQSKKSPDYSESTDKSDLSLYPSPKNRDINGWDALGFNDNQQESPFDVPRIADISGYQLNTGNEQQTAKPQSNSPNLNDNQGKGNLGSYIGNRSQVTNQRGLELLSSEQNNNQDSPFHVPAYADISPYTGQELNNDDNTPEAKIPVNNSQADNQQGLSTFEEALRGALQVMNNEWDNNPNKEYSFASLYAYMDSLPQDLSNKLAEYLHKIRVNKAFIHNDWVTDHNASRIPTYTIPDIQRLKQMLQELNEKAALHDNNIQQVPKQQGKIIQDSGLNNSEQDSKDDDYMPQEIIREKDRTTTVQGRKIPRTYIPSEREAIQKAITKGKSATRYIFASQASQDGQQTTAPHNPQKYSYDAKLTGYDGYLGDFSIGIGNNESVSHAFFGEQDGLPFVGLTDPDGNFVVTYDMLNKSFFINEGYEKSPFARRVEDDFKRQLGNNPTEEILRRLVMFKAINAEENDTIADVASRIYMEENKNLADQTGISLLNMVLADNLSIQKINRVGNNGDRGSTKITPKTDINGNPLFEAQNIVSMFKNSDASSLIHEFWHMYQEKIKRLGNAGLIKEGTRLFDDWQTIRSEAGMLQTNFNQQLSPEDQAKWRNSQEKNAAMFEKYLREGKHPQGLSKKMQQVFKTFKDWLSNIYHKITDIFYTDAKGRRRNDFAVNPRIRQVFDHIFADKRNLNLNSNNQQGQTFRSYSDPQGFQEFRQSGLSPQGWFSRLIGRAKNWAGSFFSIAHKPHKPSNLDLLFPTQEIERRFTEAGKIPSKAGTLARVKHAFLSGIKNIAAGDYADIARSQDPNVRKARNLFRQLERDKKSALAQAMKTFSDNLNGLNNEQLDLFNRARVIQDLMFRIEKVPGADLPFGLTHQQVRDMHKKLMQHVENDEAVKNAIQKEEQTIQSINQDFINAARLLGYDMSGIFSNPHYYRHRIIDYMDAIRAGRRIDTSTGNINVQDTADSMLREAFGRGYFKRYKGSTMDFVTDYVQANSEVRVQMLQDIETLKTLYKLKQEYDIAPRLKKQFGKQQDSQQLRIDDGSQSFSQSGDSEIAEWLANVPEGMTALDPTIIGLTESDKSVKENILDNAIREFSQKNGIPIDRLLEQGLTVENNIMVIPNEIAETLRKMAKSKHRGALGQAAKKLTTWWKQSVLFTPTRNLLYNIRNFTGDLDAVIAGNPHSLKHLPRAVKELTAWYTQHGKEGYEASQDLQDYIRLSGTLGIQSLNLTRADAQAIIDLFPTPAKTKKGNKYPKRAQKEAERLSRVEARMQEAQNAQEDEDPGKLKKAWAKAMWGARKFFEIEHGFTEWREHLLRFATYLDYKQQMESNKNGRPNNWGASIEEEVMSIDDIKERAFKMSNELLGPYDQISEIGRQLRDALIPFYSWMEVNMRRTWRLLKNGFKQGRDFGLKKVQRYALGKAAAVPIYAASAGWSMGKLLLLTGAMQMFNRFVFPDADDDLPNDVKYRPHVTVGEINGRVHYLDRLGSVGDWLDWFNLDSAWLDAKDFANGQQTLGGYLQKMIKAPFSKVINGLNPAIKMPIELAMGRSMFPDAFNPSTIRDPAEYVARSFGLVWQYRVITGKPHDNIQELTKLFVYSQDADEAAYWQTLDRVRQFQNQVLDKHFDGFASTRRGRILQNIKKALRYKDGEAVRRFIREFHQADGTKQGLKQSMKAMDPLHGLSEKEKAQFLKWISPDDRKYLRKAQRYFHQLTDRFLR